MAALHPPILKFHGGCPDCGERAAQLPIPLPGVDDDFDWRARDYDSFRLLLMQELAYRFPERRRWTAADMEVVLVELLSAALDRASHALDAIQAERYLDSARRPQSVRRLLKLIGYDAVKRTDPAILQALPPAPDNQNETKAEQLERYWRLNPAAMEAARAEGPRLIGEQQRMVTLADHAQVLQTHPLVATAQARMVWSGAWTAILVATLLEGNLQLDQPLHQHPPPPGWRKPLSQPQWQAINDFHRQQQLPMPPKNNQLTPRRLLRVMVERYRMLGSEVFLETAKPAPITFSLSIRARRGFFRSELKQALAEVFSANTGGFFEPGRLDFGVDLIASDIVEAAMGIEGVEVACLNRFKRVGSYPDRTAAGFIEIENDAFVLCMNRPGEPQSGSYRLTINGGELA